MVPDDHPLAEYPRIIALKEGTEQLGKSVVRWVLELRKRNLRQIAVVCHVESMWEDILKELQAGNLPLYVLLQRGDRLSPDSPIVVLTKPAYAGGQEFDAVIAVGLEQGLVPPRVQDNEALAAAVEQQALREIYLSFTRARYQLIVLISKGMAPTKVLHEARQNGLIAQF